jgi:hypothetical protein
LGAQLAWVSLGLARQGETFEEAKACEESRLGFVECPELANAFGCELAVLFGYGLVEKIPEVRGELRITLQEVTGHLLGRDLLDEDQLTSTRLAFVAADGAHAHAPFTGYFCLSPTLGAQA